MQRDVAKPDLARPLAAAGVAAACAVLLGYRLDTPAAWLGPAADGAIVVLMAVVAVMGMTDAWVRRERRRLPWAAAAVAIGVLWSAEAPVSQIGQEHAVLSVLAHAGTGLALLFASLWPSEGKLRHPTRSILWATSTAAVAAAAAVTLAIDLSGRLPSLSEPGGGATLARHELVLVGSLPLVAALYLVGGSARTGVFLEGPVVAAIVLLVGEAIGAAGTAGVGSAGWYVLVGLRLAAFGSLAFGELRRYAVSSSQELKRAKELEILALATRRMGVSLEPSQVASELARVAHEVASAYCNGPVKVRVLQADGPGMSALASHPDQDHLVVGPPALSLPIASGDEQLGALEVCPGLGSRLDPAASGLMANLVEVASLALANAETFDDLRSVEAYNRAVLMAIDDAFISVTEQGLIVGWNNQASALLGWSRAAVVGRSFVDLLAPRKHRPALREMLTRWANPSTSVSSRQSGETLLRRVDGKEVPVELTAWRVDIANASRVCLLARDISERKAAEEQLTRQATHDPLTGLPNRALVLGLLNEALDSGADSSAQQRQAPYVGVVFVDLDGFKEVNDSRGHLFGDRVLSAVASRLVEAVRASDVVGRIGGDEFLVIVRGLGTPSEIGVIASRLRLALSCPLEVDGLELQVSASVGSAVAVPGRTSGEDLICMADEAMYKQKGSHQPRLSLLAGDAGPPDSSRSRRRGLPPTGTKAEG